MKKILKISLVSMLVAMPMIAGAAPVAGEPVAGDANSPTATNTPKYALKGVGAGDDNTATAGYVKGAYNAVIKGINNTQDEINTLNTDITTYRNAIGHLTDGKATQDGTVATIKSARTNESIATSSVNFTGVTTTSISATASGNVNLSVPRMADWENDSLAETPVQTTTSFSGLAVDNLTMSAPTTNTAKLTKTGINGNVDVVKYLASMGFDFTQLIDAEPDGDNYAYKSASYPDGSSYNEAGLSNGEWRVTWNDYGTVKGTSMCSGTSGTAFQTGSPSNTEGGNCWCKMTGWRPNGDTTPAASSWVAFDTLSSPADCARNCAFNCGLGVVEEGYDMRSRLFGSVQTSMGFDFTTLINVDVSSFGHRSADGIQVINADGLSNGEWRVTWNDYGSVKGISMCSSTEITDWRQTGSPSSAEGANCWCEMTGWTPNGDTETPASSPWMFSNTYRSASDCPGYCADECNSRVQANSAMRVGMFSNVQQ